MVYLPMSYLYSLRFQMPVNDLIKSLRKELYTQEYDSIDFSLHRNSVSGVDMCHPHTLVSECSQPGSCILGEISMSTMAKRHSMRVFKDVVIREHEDSDYVCE